MVKICLSEFVNIPMNLPNEENINGNYYELNYKITMVIVELLHFCFLFQYFIDNFIIWNERFNF